MSSYLQTFTVSVKSADMTTHSNIQLTTTASKYCF